MAKESVFVGAINDSGFKNKGTSPTLGVSDKGGEDRYAKRTKSPRAQEEVLKVSYNRVNKG